MPKRIIRRLISIICTEKTLDLINIETYIFKSEKSTQERQNRRNDKREAQRDLKPIIEYHAAFIFYQGATFI
jgi:hypothetical protein